MKIKVSEATPLQLNWLVAKCEGLEIESILQKHHIIVWKPDTLTEEEEVAYVFSPATDWSQGGRIIERENIDVHAPRPVWPHWKAYKPEWNGGSGLMEGNVQYGPTLLIAAMRYYVASKLGDEVEYQTNLFKE